MKAALLLATVLVFASSTSAKYRFNCLASDKMLDVGNLDDFDAVWQHFNSTATELGIFSDKEYRTSNKLCAGDDKDLTVNVNLEGRWGSEGEVGHLEMRDALLQAMWAFIEQAIAQTTYDIYTDCPFEVQQPGIGTFLPRRVALCGPKSPNGNCPCPTPKGVWPRECYGEKISGHKLPSKISIEVLDENGELMAEELTVTFTTILDVYVDGGCGVAGAAAKLLSLFIPVIGIFFEKGITVICGV